MSIACIGHRRFDAAEGATRSSFEAVLVELSRGSTALEQRVTGQPDVEVRAPEPSPSPAASSSHRDKLPERLWRLVRFGADAQSYRHADGTVDGSRLMLAICNIAVLNAVHPQHLWKLLLKPENLGGQPLRRRLGQRGEIGARRWFDRVWQKADNGQMLRPRSFDRTEVTLQVSQLAELAASVSFPGMAGTTDRMVLGAAHRLGVARGSIYLPLSVRELSEHSGVSTNTASRSLRRLRAAGWLRLVRCSKSDRAAVYTLTAPRELAQHGDSEPLRVRGCRTGETLREAGERDGGAGLGGLESLVSGPLRALAGHDAFHAWALGKGVLETLCALRDDEWLPVTELAALTGKNRGTINRHLRKLDEAGLVERDLASYRRVLPGERQLDQRLDELAAEAGTLGFAARRKAQHDEQRRRYQGWLAAKEAEIRSISSPPGLSPAHSDAVAAGSGQVDVAAWSGRRAPPGWKLTG